MKIKFKFILVSILVFLMISAYITVSATSTSNTLPNTESPSHGGTSSNNAGTNLSELLPYTEDVDINSEEFLNKEYNKFSTIREVAQGTTVGEFIEQEKNRWREEKWYQDLINEGYTVELGNGVVYAIPGPTNRDLLNKKELSENDLVRTNVEIEIAVRRSKDGHSSVAGEGSQIGVVVKGDLTGTGEIDVTDLSTIQEELVETTQLKGLYKNAADMDRNEEIDVIDLSQLQEYIVNN